MRHFTFFACLFLVLSVSVIARAADDYDFIEFEDRDTNSTTTSDTTTGSMTTTGTTGSSTTGGSTQVYEVSLGDQNVTVSISVSGNHTLKIQFPAIGNFSAKYSIAGADLAGYADPDSTTPDGCSYKGASFFITLFYPNGSQVEGFTFSEPIVITIGVDGVSDSDGLYLYDTDTQTWSDAAATCSSPSTQIVDGNLVVAICHLTQFAVFETTSKATIAKSHDQTGLIAAVIVIPIVIVAIIIALVAWTLLRKPRKHSKSERDLEMESSSNVDRRELTKKETVESDSDTDSDSSSSEEEKPKPKPEEKKPEPVVELKKAESSESDTDSSSDSSEHAVVNKKKPEEKEESTDSDSDTDSNTDSDE